MTAKPITFVPAVATREAVPVTSLRVGELVLVSGAVLRLTDLHKWHCEYNKREVFTFRTEFVASLPGGPERNGPGYWSYLTNGWTVQGNDLARAVRVTL